jgi:hypothetical protein
MNADKTNILNSIKDQAIADFKKPSSFQGLYGAHKEIVNGNEIKAVVGKQAKISSRSYDSMYCLWYLNGKKSSLEKVLAVI